MSAVGLGITICLPFTTVIVTKGKKWPQVTNANRLDWAKVDCLGERLTCVGKSSGF
jgi:hypothetical protein